MPSAVVEAAFRARLEANWNIADGVILGSNEVFATPSDGSPFLIIQYPVSQNTRPVLTRQRFEEGAARIIYNAQSGAGLEIPLAKADVIAAAFRGDRLRIGASSNVEVFEPSPPIINDDNEEGNYVEFAVVVPYRYQFSILIAAAALSMLAASGSYSVSGEDANLTTTAAARMVADAGSYDLIGATSQNDLSFAVDVGGYEWLIADVITIT